MPAAQQQHQPQPPGQQQTQAAGKPASTADDSCPNPTQLEKNNFEDYTPPGTPQNLEPVNAEQTAQLCSTLEQDSKEEQTITQLAEQLKSSADITDKGSEDEVSFCSCFSGFRADSFHCPYL